MLAAWDQAFIWAPIQQIFVEGLSSSRYWGAAASNRKGHVSHGGHILVSVWGGRGSRQNRLRETTQTLSYYDKNTQKSDLCGWGLGRACPRGSRSPGSQEEVLGISRRAMGLRAQHWWRAGVRKPLGMRRKQQQDWWRAVAVKDGLSVGRLGRRSRQHPFQMKLSDNSEEYGETIRGLEAGKSPYFLVSLYWWVCSEEIVGEGEWRWGH